MFTICRSKARAASRFQMARNRARRSLRRTAIAGAPRLARCAIVANCKAARRGRISVHGVNARGADAPRAKRWPPIRLTCSSKKSDPRSERRAARRAGVPLTPLGSIAVDPAYHPYGASCSSTASMTANLSGVCSSRKIRAAPFAVVRCAATCSSAPGRKLGSGAERMNAPARWWTLAVPRGECRGRRGDRHLRSEHHSRGLCRAAQHLAGYWRFLVWRPARSQAAR
jgi:hypothetical protein